MARRQGYVPPAPLLVVEGSVDHGNRGLAGRSHLLSPSLAFDRLCSYGEDDDDDDDD